MSMRGTCPTVRSRKAVTRNEAIHEAEREKDITLHQVVIQSQNLQKGERKVIAKGEGRKSSSDEDKKKHKKPKKKEKSESSSLEPSSDEDKQKCKKPKKKEKIVGIIF